MKRLTPGDGRELGIVRASEPCVRKIEKVEKTVIRKKSKPKAKRCKRKFNAKKPLTLIRKKVFNLEERGLTLIRKASKMCALINPNQ